MHAMALVITENKPTKEVLEATFAPFGKRALGCLAKWYWYGLGGRFGGSLIPKIHNQWKGGQPRGYFLRRNYRHNTPGKTELGVDALQMKNFKQCRINCPPRAVLLNGKWHEADATLSSWKTRIADLMHSVPGHRWVSVVEYRR
jgi:hypothetical protein